MARTVAALLVLLFSSITLIDACGDHVNYEHARRDDEHLNRVEKRTPYPTDGPEYSIPPLSQISATTDTYSSYTLPVEATYTSGTSPSLTGAPPLPSPTADQSTYPTPDVIPPTDNAEVQAWIDAIDWDTIPQIDPNYSRICGDAQNSQALNNAGEEGNCWWTCGGCTRDTDITTCNNTMEYGLGFDDGPGLYTNKLLTYLESENLHATFYLVGSRVYYRPEIVRYEYMTGHELSVHTWSHPSLTTLTNAQIVAELGYTKKIIHEVTGVTPTTMRPPYGDIDDRVRAISLAMGLMPVIWTSTTNTTAPGTVIEWDSGDWMVHALPDQGGVNATDNQARFENILEMSSQFTDHGVIALQHDIYIETVDIAIGYTIPYLLTHNPPFTLKPIMQCQGRPDQDMYVETNTNPDSPAVSGSGDVATRTSNIGYAAREQDNVSVPASRTYATSMMGTRTPTTTASTSASHSGAASRITGSSSSAVYLAASLLLSMALSSMLVL